MSQYFPTNINSAPGSRGTDEDLILNLDDEFVIITANAPQITLPTAAQIPSRQIYIKSEPGTGSVVGILGQTIDGNASFEFTSPNEVLLVKSNGEDWHIVGGARAENSGVLTVKGGGIVVDAATSLLNFIGAGVTASPAGPGLVDVTVSGTGLPSGPLIPETNIPGSAGDIYTRVAGSVSSFWQFVAAVPGVLGWEAIGPERTATPVGAIDGINNSYSFPGGVEAVNQGADAPQIKYELNGVKQTVTTDYAVVAGSIPGTTITSIITVVIPQPGDTHEFTYIPA